MSLDTPSIDYWKKITKCRTIRERCKFVFNNELLSDVKFVVRDGVDVKKISAHKFLLANSSPVFFIMFYGELAAEKKDSIDISDCEYESLLELFRFIYSDEVNLNQHNVMEVLYLAKKYVFPSLADKCTEYLGKNLAASNVFNVLADAKRYEDKLLIEYCWRVIDKHTNEAVKSEGFPTIERSVLEELVHRESLNVKEVELLKAVDYWAANECEKLGLAAEGPVKRKILGEKIVTAIRFPVMEKKEFVQIVLDCDILTKKESFAMIKYFNSVLDFPVGFPYSKRKGSRQRMSRFRKLSNKSGWCYGYNFGGNYDSIIFSANKSITLYGVRMFGSENNEYAVSMEIQDLLYDDVLATEEGHFQSKLVQSNGEECDCFDIVLESPLVLKPHTQYCIETYTTGPPSTWNGEDGSNQVQHAGVKFHFSDKEGRTTVPVGQFFELEFSIN